MTIKKATFAGGCFWCMVKPFDQWDGVHSVISGYIGGHVKNPTYEQVKTGTTGHYEAVEITYDPDIISYETIIDLFWKQIDPLQMLGDSLMIVETNIVLQSFITMKTRKN